MNSVHPLRQLPRALLPWYSKNKRDLPWRRDREAYHVCSMAGGGIVKNPGRTEKALLSLVPS